MTFRTKKINAKSYKRGVLITEDTVYASAECCIHHEPGCCAEYDNEESMALITVSGKTKEEALATLRKVMEKDGWRDYETSGEMGWACGPCIGSYRELNKEEPL